MRDAVAVGICVVSSEVDIQQRVVECESAVMRFPDASKSTPLPLALDKGGGGPPKIVVLEKHFEIAPDSMYVHLGDASAGPFVITNTANVDPGSVEWSVDSGTMTPATGASSTLVIGQLPTEDDPIVVTAAAEFDEVFTAEDTALVWLCIPHGLLLQSATSNFSPHLGETSAFSLDVPGCQHHFVEGWIEAEVMRETTEGWQHVCWIDVSLAQPGHQKRRLHKAESLAITWDGIATEDAALADSPDVFTEGSAPFHRALPEVVSGEPVPLPHYTIFFRYREADSDTATVIDETSTTVYVPQVVKIEMTDEAFEEFKRPILHPETYYPDLLGDPEVAGCESNILIFAGAPTTTKSQLLSAIADKCASQYPVTVNIRFTCQQPRGQKKTVLTTLSGKPLSSKLGSTSDLSFPNKQTSGNASVYVDSIRGGFTTEKYRYDNEGMNVILRQKSEIPTLFPFSEDNLVHALASIASHETGHMLGLVSEEYLGGAYGHHNTNSYVNGWIMNSGNLTPMVYYLGSHANRISSWRPQNVAYLEFILPKEN